MKKLVALFVATFLVAGAAYVFAAHHEGSHGSGHDHGSHSHGSDGMAGKTDHIAIQGVVAFDEDGCAAKVTSAEGMSVCLNAGEKLDALKAALSGVSAEVKVAGAKKDGNLELSEFWVKPDMKGMAEKMMKKKSSSGSGYKGSGYKGSGY